MSRTDTGGLSRAAIINEHRDLIELVAEGDDEPAEWARQWLQEVDGDD